MKLRRQLAPGIWEDTEGALHLSIPEILQHFGLEDTQQNRDRMMDLAKELLAEQLPKAKIVETE
jgi:hypothetical protein